MTLLCDECNRPAAFLAYAAYPVGIDNDPHPRVAHYPGAMIRACDQHIAERLTLDAYSFGSTRSWLLACAEVEPVGDGS